MRKLKVTAVVLTCVMVTLVVMQWPDIRRYIKMKRM
ncbi:DUF6893 family small protein [Microtetraspora sp. AC03309]